MAQEHVAQLQAAAPDESHLNPQAIQWIAQLPQHVQPHLLGYQFPRIVNTLADKWHQVMGCRFYLESLLCEQQGARPRFAFEIVQELLQLRQYFDSLYRPHHDIWRKSFDAHRGQLH